MRIARLSAVSALVCVAACGGGGGSGGSGSPNPIQGASPGGIWHGTDSASGLAIIALVDEAGNADFIRADNALLVGQVSTTGDSIYAMVEGYAAETKTFPDGSTHGSGTISGTIQERQSISAHNQFTTDAGTSTQGTVDLTFDPLYNRPSSLATVAGSFNLNPGEPIEIHSDGVIYQIAPMCQESGQISIINPTYNLYKLQLTVSCHGMPLSTWSGLATLDNTVTPERLVFGVSGGNPTYGIAVVGSWPRCDPQMEIC